MNETQRKILIATACVVALMVIFPPYIQETLSDSVRDTGYDFLFDLPYRSFVNVKMLLVQFFGTTIIGGLVFFATKR